MGDISISLFPKDTPKTFENFTTHAKSGYYNNTIFHRVRGRRFSAPRVSNAAGSCALRRRSSRTS
jgi:hypothetical protein